jgi:uncharacterized protein involved in oxidation of intracellular sulfur
MSHRAKAANDRSIASGQAFCFSSDVFSNRNVPPHRWIQTPPFYGGTMAILLILNHQPYDGSDVTWNALRLAQRLHEDGAEVRIFLMNDSVDLARDGITPPEGTEDMVKMLKTLIASGVPVKVCGTCQNRCGVLKGQPYYEGAQFSTMAECSEWVRSSEKVLTF